MWAIDFDLARIGVDAVVSSVDIHGRMIGESSAALKRVGGDEIEAQAIGGGRHKLSSAWHTEGGSLEVKWVIHTATLDASESNVEEVVRDATRACLVKADQLAVTSLAFPALNAGRVGLRVEDAARLMTDAIARYVAESPDTVVQDVVFVLYGQEQYDDFVRSAREVLDTMQHDPDGSR